MSTIKDFPCTYLNAVGIKEEVTKKLDLSFPKAYLEAESMVQIAKALKEYEGTSACTLPFCHTVEGEALGGKIQYGNDKVGPRASDYCCNSLEEVLALQDIDPYKGRMGEVLLAISSLKSQGEKVILMVSGPFTVLNCLVDIKHVLRGLRKTPEIALEVFHKIGKNILIYVQAAINAGVDLISYADSSGGVNILGPKLGAFVAEKFTYPFLKELSFLVKQRAMLHLCPKTTFALLGTDLARIEDVLLEEPMRYEDACLLLHSKVAIGGQMCLKNTTYRIENKRFKEIVLKESEE